MTGNIISDTKLNKALNVIFNVWFQKWKCKLKTMTDKDWDTCIHELNYIAEQGEYPVVATIGIALLDELDARVKGGYRSFEGEKEKNERR